MTITMFALFAISGVLGGTTLACVAPRAKHAARIETLGGLLFMAALASIGVALAGHLCL